MNSQDFLSLVKEGRELAHVLERAQAEMPLSKRFDSLQEDISHMPFSMVLLGLSPEALSAALGWFYGKDYSVLSVQIIEKLGLVEIYLSEQGFMIEQGSERRMRFEGLEAFLEASQSNDVLGPFCSMDENMPFADTVRLGVHASTGLKGIRLLVPKNTRLLLDKPALLSRVATQSNVLILVGDVDAQLSAIDIQAIEGLLESTDAIWPLLRVDERAVETINEEGWWTGFKEAGVQIPPVLLTTHVSAEIPELLTDTQEQTRHSLFLQQHKRRLNDAIDTLDDMVKIELRQLKSRIKRENRKSSNDMGGMDDDKAIKSKWDELKADLMDTFQQISRSLDKPSSQGTKGSTSKADLKSFIGGINFDDLDKEEGYKTIKLTVKKSMQESMMNFIYSGFKEEVNIRVQKMSRQLDTLANALRQGSESLSEKKLKLQSEAFNANELLNEIKNSLDLNVRYRGEMPKRGFYQRLLEGRKAMFGILMLSSMMGKMLGMDIASGRFIGFVLFVTFFGSVLYTFFAWKREDADKQDKELDRVRDGIAMEAKRLKNELDRELQKQLGYHLQSLQKSYQRELDEAMNVSVDTARSQKTQEQSSSRERIRVLEKQLRELENSERSIQQLKNAARR